MPTKPKAGAKPVRFTSYSFSRWHDYTECPAFARYKHLDKLPGRPPGPAMARGNAIHKLAENYALGKIRQLPPELSCFTEEFAALRKVKKQLIVEQQWAFDKSWQPVGWFDDDVLCRVILDVGHYTDDVGRGIDHKTGKVYPYHHDQLSLQGLALFKQAEVAGNGPIKEAIGELWYLDQGTDDKVTYKLSDVPKLIKLWEKNTARMLADQSFKPTPGQKCRYCDYSCERGGPCRVA